MKYAPFPLPPMMDASNPVRCRCHKMLTEMMIIYESIIECLQAEDIRRPPKKKRKSRAGMTYKTKYKKDLTKPMRKNGQANQ
jgi:hypothetical protein